MEHETQISGQFEHGLIYILQRVARDVSQTIQVAPQHACSMHARHEIPHFSWQFKIGLLLIQGFKIPFACSRDMVQIPTKRVLTSMLDGGEHDGTRL